MQSAYNVIVNDIYDLSVVPNRTIPWNSFWKIEIPLKLFLWKRIHGCLAVIEIHAIFVRNVEQVCPLCTRQTKSIQHVLFECSFAKNIWWLIDPNNVNKIQNLGFNGWFNDWLTNPAAIVTQRQKFIRCVSIFFENEYLSSSLKETTPISLLL